MTVMHLHAETICAEIDGVRLLTDVTMAAGPGEFVGIIGPNGAGKTTLLKVLAGLHSPIAGAVRLSGRDIGAMDALARARALAYLAQDRRAEWNSRARAIVSLGRFAHGSWTHLSPEDKRAIDKALGLTRMREFSTRTMSTLSGGEAARIHLARALASETRVLLADEPAANLDPAQALAVMRLLQGKANDGGVVVAAMHDLLLARRFTTRLVALDRGTVVADGAPANVLTPALLQDTFNLTYTDSEALGLV